MLPLTTGTDIDSFSPFDFETMKSSKKTSFQNENRIFNITEGQITKLKEHLELIAVLLSDTGRSGEISCDTAGLSDSGVVQKNRLRGGELKRHQKLHLLIKTSQPDNFKQGGCLPLFATTLL